MTFNEALRYIPIISYEEYRHYKHELKSEKGMPGLSYIKMYDKDDYLSIGTVKLMVNKYEEVNVNV